MVVSSQIRRRATQWITAGAMWLLLGGNALACSTLGPVPRVEAGEAAVARYLQPFVTLAANTEELGRRIRLLPYEYDVPPDYTLLFEAVDLFQAVDQEALVLTRLSGFRAFVFSHCSNNTIVVAFPGMYLGDPRQYWTIAIRRASSPTLAVRFTELITEMYPDQEILLVGHSGGGGMAIYAGTQFGLPVIAFNPAMPPYIEGINGGPGSIRVVVRGDVMADPSATGRDTELYGRTLWLETEGVRFLKLHSLDAVMIGLEALLD